MANPRSMLIELQVEDIHGLDSQFYFQVKGKKNLMENFFSVAHKETLGLMASKNTLLISYVLQMLKECGGISL